jgi:hypothetical protein
MDLCFGIPGELKAPTKKASTKPVLYGGLIRRPIASQPSRTPNGEPFGVEEACHRCIYTRMYIRFYQTSRTGKSLIPRRPRKMSAFTVEQLSAMAEEGDAYADSLLLSFENERLVHCA